MGADPLDWTAVPFLTLYVALAALVFGVGFFRRSEIGPAKGRPRVLSELEWAYLAGGPSRVGDVALLCLMARGGGSIDPGTNAITVTDTTPLSALWGARVAMRFSPGLSRQAFQLAISPLVEQVRERLQMIGYAPTNAQMAAFRLSTLPFVAVLMAFGAAKAVVGSGRHHPIGILIFLLVATAGLGLALASRPLRTRAGEAALDAHRAANARSARAPLTGELMLAVALSGAVVLSGTEFAPIYAATRAGAGGSGSDGGSGCGGGGGGGCGGCS